MKKIFTLICAFSVSYFASAQTDHSGHNHGPVNGSKDVKKVDAAPEALSLKEVEFDFGKIPQGKPVTHVFTFTNTGTTPLKLENVQASCGCTTPEWNKDETLAPGQSSKITVGYNAAAEGAFAKPITITYNGNQTKQFIIKGEVWKTPTTSAPENSGLGSLKKQ